MDNETQVAQVLAPEDLAPGQFVTPLHRIREHMPFFCTEESVLRRSEPFRMTWLGQSGGPVRVLDVCLPFVLIETPRGKTRMIDVRLYKLARVADRFGAMLFERARSEAKSKAGESGDAEVRPSGNSPFE